MLIVCIINFENIENVSFLKTSREWCENDTSIYVKRRVLSINYVLLRLQYISPDRTVPRSSSTHRLVAHPIVRILSCSPVEVNA
jgi:hypothetical protein